MSGCCKNIMVLWRDICRDGKKSGFFGVFLFCFFVVRFFGGLLFLFYFGGGGLFAIPGRMGMNRFNFLGK